VCVCVRERERDYFVVTFLVIDVSERRQAESGRIREKYPDRVPVRTHYQLRIFTLYAFVQCTYCSNLSMLCR
jgi:hypothetical protein